MKVSETLIAILQSSNNDLPEEANRYLAGTENGLVTLSILLGAREICESIRGLSREIRLLREQASRISRAPSHLPPLSHLPNQK